MRIAVGSDHAGFEGPRFYKPEIMKYLEEKGYETVDCGTNGPESVDYPLFAGKVCEAVLSGRAERGVLICGTGLGVAMAANRYRGIRAAPCATPEMAQLAREHNNANVLCLGRRTLELDQCFELIDLWLETPFSEGERHIRRLREMDE